MIVAFLLQAAPLGEAYALGDEMLAETTLTDAVAVFERVCLQPFPDPAGFEAAAARDPAGLARVSPGAVGEAAQNGEIHAAHGGVWTGRRVNVRYTSSDQLAASIPQPQCTVTVRLPEGVGHAKLANSVGTTLKLGDSTDIAVGEFIRTYWNIPQANGTRWRIMVKSEAGSLGSFMSIGLIKLKSSR
jgi:hypothetical protein